MYQKLGIKNYIRDDFKKKTVKLVTLSKKGGRGQENGKIWNVGEKMTFS